MILQMLAELPTSKCYKHVTFSVVEWSLISYRISSMKCMLDVRLHEWLWRGDCTALAYIIGHLRISLVFLSALRCPAEAFFFPKQISSNVRGCSLEVTQKEVVWMARSDENICCSIGLQWPNPHNKESLWFTHCLLEKDGKTCQLPEHDILPVIPLFFFSGGYPGPQSCGDLPLPLYWEQRGGGWRVTASRLYHYCSLSACSIQRKNDRGDNPLSSLSGSTDWKLLDCSLEVLECVWAHLLVAGTLTFVLHGSVCV